MARDKAKLCELDQEKYDADDNVQIICLGASAVGKSKLMERFLTDGFQFQQLSTYTLTLYKHTATIDGETVLVDFWDTAGQERFPSMHASCYHKAHSCIMVFDVQTKITYKNLLEPSYTVGGNADWKTVYGKQCGDFLKNWK